MKYKYKKRNLLDILKDIRKNLNEKSSQAFDCGGSAVLAWENDIEDAIGNNRFSIEISSKYSKIGRPILIDIMERV